MERKGASDFNQELLDLFDKYVHGGIDRRAFLDGASRYAVSGVTAAALVESLSPNYALAQQVATDDARIKAQYVTYQSPKGSGSIRGLLARPARAAAKLPGVLVIHENRGLNPYIEDVARRLGVAGFLALAPDALTPVGGYPGDDDKGRELQSKLDRTKMTEDFIAGVEHLKSLPDCSGRLGAVGFCFGGGMVNTLATRLPELNAAVPFYGAAPAASEVPKIKAALLIQYAEIDENINKGRPGYEAALKSNGVKYEMHTYPGTNHGFHNDSTPRYDKAAAQLAWDRTIDFFNKTLK
jgi:carboxymethylenebutenolidase